MDLPPPLLHQWWCIDITQIFPAVLSGSLSNSSTVSPYFSQSGGDSFDENKLPTRKTPRADLKVSSHEIALSCWKDSWETEAVYSQETYILLKVTFCDLGACSMNSIAEVCPMHWTFASIRQPCNIRRMDRLSYEMTPHAFSL